MDSLDAGAAAEKIKDLAAVSQSLGGFQLALTALAYAFQYPITIDPKDDYSKTVAACIEPENPQFQEPSLERFAVRENTQVFPLREGFFRLSKLALVTSFGLQRKIMDDELAFKGTRYISENLRPVSGDLCFFPLALTSAARLSAYLLFMWKISAHICHWMQMNRFRQWRKEIPAIFHGILSRMKRHRFFYTMKRGMLWQICRLIQRK